MRAKPIFSQSIALLKHAAPFGQGAVSVCYVHPDNPDLCIKVQKPELTAAAAPWKPTENAKTAHGYRQKAVRHGDARLWEHLPRLHGWQNTDLGLGLVSDYYSTPDGAPAPTLRALLQTHGMTREMNQAIAAFVAYLCDTRLLTRRIAPHNLVYARDGRLKLIDDMGGRWVAFADLHTSLGTWRIRRTIRDLHKRIAWELSDRTQPSRKWRADDMGRWLPALDHFTQDF